MTRELRKPTMSELEELTPEGQREMAAARLTLSAVSLLHQAQAASGLTQRELAEWLGVSDGRVSQVLGGDGNIRISTLARYLRAMGYVPSLDAEPASDAVPPLRRKRAPRRRRSVPATSHVYAAPVEHSGTSGIKTIVMSVGMPLNATETSAPRLVGHLDHSTSQVGWFKVTSGELES